MSNLNITISVEDKQKDNLQKDAILNALRTKTPQEINQYIEDNINDFADVKEHLKILTQVVAYSLRSV